MKHVFSRITAAIFIAGIISLLVACADKKNESSKSGTIPVLIPMNDSEGRYSLDVFKLQGISDLKKVAGSFARFFLSPGIVNNKLNGVAPKARFLLNDDGVHIPSDEMSQQLASVYAHMQRLAALDKELGVENVNKWPRDIGVAVRISGSLNSTNNAFYDGKTDSMLFLPYVAQSLSIPINGGILAHEHFHSLFYKQVARDPLAQIHSRADFLSDFPENQLGVQDKAEEDLPELHRGREIAPVLNRKELPPEKVHYYYHLVLIRALNEGLADYWGWMYTGNPDFLAQSLPAEKASRSLDVRDEKFAKTLPSEQHIKTALEFIHNGGIKFNLQDCADQYEECATGFAYNLAPQFARFMKKYVEVYALANQADPLEARKDVAKTIIKMLPDIKSDLRQINDKYYNSIDFLNTFIKHAGKLTQVQCGFLADAFNNSKSDQKFQYNCKNEGEWKIITEKAIISVLKPQKEIPKEDPVRPGDSAPEQKNEAGKEAESSGAMSEKNESAESPKKPETHEDSANSDGPEKAETKVNS